MIDHQCSMCPYQSPSLSSLLHHLVRRHRNAPKFVVHCNAVGCGASFRNYVSFKSHVKRKHYKEIQFMACGASNNDDPYFLIENDVDTNDKLEDRKMEAAFLLKLKAAQNLSNAALNEVITSVRELCQTKLNKAKANIAQQTDDVHDASRMFEDLDSDYKREKFFQRELGAVYPKPVKMGTRITNKKTKGRYRIVQEPVHGFYVPFLEQLSTLLSMPEVILAMQTEREYAEGLMTDVTDGLYLRNHKFLQDHPDAILLSLYSDDFEIVNPIGSHRKVHKLCVFYYVLLNIPPEFRSKLSVIQLVAVTKSAHAKMFGISNLLSDFLRGLEQLHNGTILTVGNSRKEWYGMLAYFLADTLAAQVIGGFKEGVGFAKKPCRTCDVTTNELGGSLFASTFPERNRMEHEDRCTVLESVSKKSRVYWSKEYGINEKSFLVNVPGFDITKCLLHDPMHVLLEGVVRMELRLLFSHLILEKKLFSITDLNTAIQNFPYSESESRDKPQLIERKELDHDKIFRQSAASMKNLIFLLPYMVGHLIPEDDQHWLNFLRLLQITTLCLSPVTSERTYSTMMYLIACHNKTFLELYPSNSFTPKLHYMIHFPKQMILFGPLRNHWCMRLEAKHSLFKRRRWFNFKSIAKSIADYHQRWMCLQQIQTSGEPSETYLYCGDEVKEGQTVDTAEHPIGPVLVSSEHEAFICEAHVEVMLTKEVKIRGHSYLEDTVLLINWEDGDVPQLVVIRRMVVHEHDKYFTCKTLEVLEFASHYNSFLVQEKEEWVVLKYTSLRYKWPQSMRKIRGGQYVMLQYVDEMWML